MSKYIPLHVHDCGGSILDAISHPDQIADRLVELGIECCALTSHGSISTAINFVQAMNKKKIKPILGIEMYICKEDATIKTEENRKLLHLLLYAKNDLGWKTLLKIVSESNKEEHYYYKPRLSLQQLIEFADGNIIAAAGHLGSVMADAAMKEYSGALLLAQQFEGWFGKGNFYLECQLLDTKILPEMETLTHTMRKISGETGIPLICTPDAHYCRKEDADDQRVMLCRNLGNKTLKDCADGSQGLSAFFLSDCFHIPSADEMMGFGHTEEELANTVKLADSCQEYTDILRSPQLPEFPCPEGYNPDTWLRQLCRNGWKKKIQNKIAKEKQPEYVERIKEELEVIQNANLSSYFLIVLDIINFVEEKGFLVGPGRGSSSGCLISYLVSITKIDPLKYNLLFERFYNSARSGSLPDIDIDVPSTARDMIVEYVKEKYGQDNVAQMLTYTRAKGRGILTDVLKVHGISFAESKTITKMLPDSIKEGHISDQLKDMEKPSIIMWALENDDKGEFRDICYIDEEGRLQGKYAKYFEQAIRLEGIPIATGKHPAGIIIYPHSLSNICPMVLDNKTKKMIAGFAMDEMEAVGGVKIDVLGLSLLAKIMGVVDILETGDIKER